jgi:hypothetical protein
MKSRGKVSFDYLIRIKAGGPGLRKASDMRYEMSKCSRIQFLPTLSVVAWSAISAAAFAAETELDFQPSQVLWQQAGDLKFGVRHVTNGVRLESLRDAGQQQEFLSTNQLPLFRLILRRTPDQAEATLNADAGWGQISARGSNRQLILRWAKPLDDSWRDLTVAATATALPTEHAWHWALRVENKSSEWGVWRIIFPQVNLVDLGPGAEVLFPRGPGEVQRDVWSRSFQYHGQYPGGWCSMQFMAAYRTGTNPTGLYVALHDPWGSTKDLEVASDPEKRSVRLHFEHPASNMGVPGQGFELSGDAVWQLLRGDWFDAALIYKQWVRQDSRWWPKLGRAGREDTPLWMRELCAWAMTGGGPENCVASVEKFKQFLGVPAGFHWYNWHQIPFDNDYPHYFPAKTGFAEGVRRLQEGGVFVMPYINGRLWDSLDNGALDAEFSQRAFSAATKKTDGKAYLESYGSKETNGEPVRLAAMCPATDLWQQTVRDIVLKLLKEVKTSAVYIDQVAAAAPTLCLDPKHEHPLGGGHWWNEGYWKMLETIRRDMPREAMITTECNGEPFVRWFDGYLTWHWQHDGQVPAFPAIYGGAVQMFGRAYRGGATKDLALRMKAGQQLVFGEQLGWLDPSLVDEKENAEFFRQAVQVRHRFRRYFYAGEMARPPRLVGNIPRVKADWQWSGEWWVNTDAVLTGAWRIPTEKRLLLLFVNVGDQRVTASVPFNGVAYGIAARNVGVVVTEGAKDPGTKEALPLPLSRQVMFAARQMQAWELSWE